MTRVRVALIALLAAAAAACTETPTGPQRTAPTAPARTTIKSDTVPPPATTNTDSTDFCGGVIVGSGNRC